MSFISRLPRITTIILDLDGVLTDGTVYISESGEQLRRMNIKDGYAIQLAIRKGYTISVISGGKSETVIKRLNGLGIQDVFLGISDKRTTLDQFLASKNKSYDEVMYIGDDVPDLNVMELVSIAACPLDAVDQIKAISHYISQYKGGEGCVRELIEKVMRAREDWNNEFSETVRSA